MADIVLTTLNARYSHASFGLRYLMANLGELAPRAVIREFDINQGPLEVLEAILAERPRIVGIGVYIWNATQSLRLVADLKRLRPDITVILGGPEVSYETDQQEIIRLADYTITGEADLAFAELCGRLVGQDLSCQNDASKGTDAESAGQVLPYKRIIAAPLPAVEKLKLPYDLYTDADLAHRVIYVEASRGCPFKCEFCLSSLDVPVRNFPLDEFLGAMGRLYDRGLRQFKFVDRTFNLNLNISTAILQFFLDRITSERDLFVHFEMIPDRLPERLRELIAQFPPGSLQFEVGIQTFNDDVSERISRRQDNARVADNFAFLREQTGVHIHADLIAGLPGEDMASFAAGFDRLVSLRPQEIQVGILKRLRGTPIVRHDQAFGMRYSPHPPYEVLETDAMPFEDMQRMRRFSRYWDMIANSGKFPRTTPLIWSSLKWDGSPFASFMALTDWLYEQLGRTHAIALDRLAQRLFDWLTTEAGLDPAQAAPHLAADIEAGGRRDRPEFLIPHLGPAERRRHVEHAASLPRRQARHLTNQ